MRTEANARAAIALLVRALETHPFHPEVRALLAGEITALRYVLREEPRGPDMTLEGLLLKYARFFEVEDAKTEAGVTP